MGLLRNRYEIIGLAGRGGMGAVYQAIDMLSRPQRRVAIKELTFANAVNSDKNKAIRRFLLEASILRSLNHPNLPRVYESFHENGRYYLVMDFINGQTLAQKIGVGSSSPLRLPYEEVLGYAAQLCNVLDYLHRQDKPIIFRDLKPQNVMVTPGGHIYLIDFGIARFFKPGQAQDTEKIHTPGYTAPELYRDEQTEPRSDLYSLGATMHHCLTAQDPAQNNKPTMFDFPPLGWYVSNLPADLDALVFELLQKNPDQRPINAYVVEQRLEKIMADLGVALVQQGQVFLLPGPTVYAHPNNPTVVGPTGTATVPAPPAWRQALADAMRQFAFNWSNFWWPAIAAMPGRLLVVLLGLFTLSGIRRLRTLRFADVKRGVSAGYVTMQIWLRGLASPALTPRFMFVLLLRLTAWIIGSRWVFLIAHNSFAVLAYVLTWFLVLSALFAAADPRLRDGAARRIFLVTGMCALLAALAALALPEVQQFLHALTVNRLLLLLLPFVAGLVLLRPRDRLLWLDRAAASLVALVCALLVYNLGAIALAAIPGLAFVLNAPPATLTLYNYALAAPFAGCALYFATRAAVLLRAGVTQRALVPPFWNTFEHLLLLLFAIVPGGLAVVYGYQELVSMNGWLPGAAPFLSSNLYLGDSIIALIAIPLLLAIIALIFGKRHPYASRLSLAVLALACLPLLNVYGNTLAANLPWSSAVFFPLNYAFIGLFTLNQLLVFLLIITGLLLLARHFSKPGGIDRAALFVVALACAFLQSSFWASAAQQASSSISGAAPTLPSQLLSVAFNQLIASALLYVVACGLGLALLMLLSRVARNLDWVERLASSHSQRLAWVDGLINMLDRVTVFGVILISALLLDSFVAGQPWLQQRMPLQGLFPGSAIPWSDAILGIEAFLAICIVVAFFMAFFPRPISRWSRFFVLVGVGVLLWLTFTDSRVQDVTSPIANRIQVATGRIFQSIAPGVLLALALACAAAISLLWLKRAAVGWRIDYLVRFVQIVLFAGATLFILFQGLWPVLLPAACIMLIMGQSVAIQMERVR